MNEFLNFVMDISNEIKKDKEELKQCAKELLLPFTICFTVIIGLAFSVFVTVPFAFAFLIKHIFQIFKS